MKSYCSLQIWVLSYVLKSFTEEVWFHQTNMTVTTHAAVSFSFSFVFTHDLCNTHYITYFMAHLFYAFLAPPIVVGVLLTCQSLDPEYIYIYIYAFSRRFYPKRLTLHSSYSFTFYQLLLSLGIEPMILTLLAPCSTI